MDKIMCNLPANWDQLESEYNNHYDPYSSTCPRCGGEDYTEESDGTYTCDECGYNLKDD